MNFERYLRLNTGLAIYDYDVLSIGEKERKKAHKDLCLQVMEWILDCGPEQADIRRVEHEVYATFQDIL